MHLLNETGAVVSQADGVPLQGFYPTSHWQPDEFIPADFVLPLPPDLSPGDYRVWFGLYDPVSGTRIPVVDSTGPAGDNYATLATLDIHP